MSEFNRVGLGLTLTGIACMNLEVAQMSGWKIAFFVMASAGIFMLMANAGDQLDEEMDESR